MSDLWEHVTVRRWLNDRVVYCRCHSIITILHKQGQMTPDKNRNIGGQAVGQHYEVHIKLFAKVFSVSLTPGRNSPS